MLNNSKTIYNLVGKFLTITLINILTMRKDLFSWQNRFCQMRSWHLFLTTLFMLLFGNMYAQTVGTQTFTANGVDSDNFQIVVLPADITVNGGATIQSVKVSTFVSHYDSPTGGTTWCDNWYAFDMAVTGGVADGFSVSEGCGADIDGTDITGFSNITITSQDIDDWSDDVYIELTLEVTYENGGGDPEPVYCTIPAGTNNDATGLTNVTFADIDNDSSTSNTVYYEDFTSVSTTVTAGDSYDLSARVNTAGNWTVQTRAWIDWNNDGTFDTATEEYNLGSALNVADGTTSLSPVSVMVPADAAAGNYRMRVRAVYGTTAVPNPCTAQNYSEAEDYTIVVEEGTAEPEGCLTATYGQYPAATFVPACYGSAAAITTLGYAGEYSKVTVTNGTEYIFSSSIATDFITIGNEAGDTVLASGTGSVTWTATMGGNIRFYTHADADCTDEDEFRSRIVQCGEPITFDDPAFDCFQGDGSMSALENGYGVNPTDIYRVADDFVVAADTEFSLQQVTINVLSATSVTNATINIHSDNAGAPGGIVNTVTMAPTSSEVFGTAFGFDAHRLVFDLATPFELTAGTYWLEPTISNSGGTTVYWEMTTLGSTGAIVQLSNTSGTTWVPDDSGDNYQAVFFVAGECNTVTGPDGCLEADPDLPQWPTSTFVPACNGTAQVIASNCWTGEYSMVQVTAGTEYTFSSSVDTDLVTISDEAGTTVYAAGVSAVNWTAPADGLVRFYLHLDEDCNWGDDVSRSRMVQCGELPPPQDGCLTASFGQYPSATFVPACIGVPQSITDLAYAGEYSMVQVTAGTEYIFSSSIATDFITIGTKRVTQYWHLVQVL